MDKGTIRAEGHTISKIDLFWLCMKPSASIQATCTANFGEVAVTKL